MLLLCTEMSFEPLKFKPIYRKTRIWWGRGGNRVHLLYTCVFRSRENIKYLHLAIIWAQFFVLLSRSLNIFQDFRRFIRCLIIAFA